MEIMKVNDLAKKGMNNIDTMVNTHNVWQALWEHTSQKESYEKKLEHIEQEIKSLEHLKKVYMSTIEFADLQIKKYADRFKELKNKNINEKR